ncbi:MAG: aminotransferase class I/II-fold pyridoxal phosphate-dependent enzyme, partial [Alphaproteobacteria bacterium]|nr:aminotransferase class I/II-fold pyridoxal phosphate-dependent enzyme [Alphaproteobacteria bacterium]
MALKVSQRGMIPPFLVMDIMQAAAEREAEQKAVYHLEVGQPGTPAPQGVLAAAKRALDENRLGYTLSMGILELRTAIANHYAKTYNVDLDPARVVVTTGSSAGFVLSFLSAFDPGDRVAMASPGYPCYRNILSAFGIEPVLLLTEAEHRFQPTPELLEKAVREGGPIDGLVIASPSNPTGTMIGPDEMSALTGYCRENNIRLISDEIYHGLTYENTACTALAYEENAVIINSFSKYFSMTGWRLGWMVIPEDLTRAVECLAQNLFISAPTLSQIGGVAAFDCEEELSANIVKYKANRDLLLEQLPKAGFDRLAPVDGAFYIYADVAELTNDSLSFCRRILNETGVAIASGVDFDPDRGHRYVRFSFAESAEQVAGAA